MSRFKPVRIRQEIINEYLERGYWSKKTLSDYLDEHAAKSPEREAIVDSKGRYTFRELKGLVNGLASKFVEMGIEDGDLIVLQIPECVEYFVVRLACEKAGLVSMVEPRTFRHREMEHVLATTGASTIVIPWKFRNFDYFEMIKELKPNLPALKHIIVIGDSIPDGAISLNELMAEPTDELPASVKERKIDPTEISYLASTTGTTGLPKIIQQFIAGRVSACVQHVKEWKITEKDIVVPFAPLSGAVGMTIGFHCALIAGAKSVMREHYSGADEMLDLIEKERVTVASVVPAQLSRLVDCPNLDKYDVSSLRAIRCGGGYLPPDLAKKAEEVLGCEVLIGYGGQDFGSISSVPAGSPPEVRRTTVGRPLPGNIIKILDDEGNEVPQGEVGEIAVRSVSAPDGYIDDQEANKATYDAEGFGKTGDLGRIDENGYLSIVGRKKDIIIRGGQNIFPGEIENLLVTHPDISAAAVVGMPDREMGERCCAFVIPKEGKTLAFDDVVNYLKSKGLAPFKLPERLECISEFPLAGGMKIDKKALRAQIEKKLKEEGKL